MNNVDFTELLLKKKYIEKFEKFQELSYKVCDLMNYNDMFTDKDRAACAECGEFVTFGITEDEQIRVHEAHFCRKRFCMMCQWRKSEKQFSNCLKLSERLSAQGYRFLHLVLTVPNCKGGAELVKTIKNMNKAFGLFIKNKEIKRAFKGILRCLELSYNYDSFSFHPHFHCLVAVKKSYFTNNRQYIKYDRLRELWTKAYKSKEPLQISISTIKGDDNIGFAEVSKYCLKPLDFTKGTTAQNAYVLYTLAYTLKGTRFQQSYGVIKTELAEIKEQNERAEIIKQMYDYVWDYREHKYKERGEKNTE